MKTSKIFSLLIAVVTVGAISFYVSTFIINGKKADDTIADQVKENQPSVSVRANVEGTNNGLTNSDSIGAVAINATLLSEKSSPNQLVFEIVMNTHSVDLLQYDLTKLAAISFGTDTNIPGTFECEPSSNDSHHMMGYLKWNGTLEQNYKLINLDLKNIDNVTSRSFSWDKSNKIDKILNK